MLNLKDIPLPEDLVDYEDGTFSAVMFHFSPSGVDLGDIAEEHGFECMILSFTEDCDEDHELRIAYEDGEDIVSKWEPRMTDGWQIAAKFDDDDTGPFAVFIRSRDEAQVAA